MKEKFSYPDRYYDDAEIEEKNDALGADTRRENSSFKDRDNKNLNSRIAFFGRHNLSVYYDLVKKSKIFEVISQYVSDFEGGQYHYRVKDENIEAFDYAIKNWIGKFNLPVDVTWKQWTEGLDDSESYFQKIMERCLVVEELEKKISRNN
jgi:hypothetical protein